jgi:hypothetical protein
MGDGHQQRRARHEAWPHEAAAVVYLHVSHGFRNSEASCRMIRTLFEVRVLYSSSLL